MILVKVSQSCIQVTGHAGSDSYGKGTVCAAVSVLVQNLARSMGELTEDSIPYGFLPGMAVIRYKNSSAASRLLINFFYTGIRWMNEAGTSQQFADKAFSPPVKTGRTIRKGWDEKCPNSLDSRSY